MCIPNKYMYVYKLLCLSGEGRLCLCLTIKDLACPAGLLPATECCRFESHLRQLISSALSPTLIVFHVHRLLDCGCPHVEKSAYLLELNVQ